jgi:hypothetical protein
MKAFFEQKTLPEVVNCAELVDLFCRMYFRSGEYKLSNRSESDLHHVYGVKASKHEYIAKFATYHNPTSLVRLNAGLVDSMLKLSERCERAKRLVKIPQFSAACCTNVGAFFLMSKEPLECFHPNGSEEMAAFGRAIRDFHDLGNEGISKQGLTHLPWNCFTPEMRAGLEKHGRWHVVEKFLNRYSAWFELTLKSPLVVSHNDLHPGNVFKVKGKYLFLDLNDLCVASPLNDLGNVVANYIVGISESSEEFDEFFSWLLKGYYYDRSRLSHDENVAILTFALRKLYLIEAYFTYSMLANRNRSKWPVAVIHEHQRKLEAHIRRRMKEHQ